MADFKYSDIVVDVKDGIGTIKVSLSMYIDAAFLTISSSIDRSILIHSAGT